MDRAKYIILENSMLEVPIIFPMHVKHCDMAHMFRGINVLSAGFVQLQEGQLVAFGESLTLKIQSRPEDTALLQRILGLKE